tara:strand:+ start:87 stop:221 length:135 start_codon:yes stop_codon:yes gene_type:complete
MIRTVVKFTKGVPTIKAIGKKEIKIFISNNGEVTFCVLKEIIII